LGGKQSLADAARRWLGCADFVEEVDDGGVLAALAAIGCCGSAVSGPANRVVDGSLICSLVLSRLRSYGHGARRRRFDQLGQLAEVLGDRGEQELVLGTGWATQSKAVEPEDALEMGKQHLDLLPLAA